MKGNKKLTKAGDLNRFQHCASRHNVSQAMLVVRHSTGVSIYKMMRVGKIARGGEKKSELEENGVYRNTVGQGRSRRALQQSKVHEL